MTDDLTCPICKASAQSFREIDDYVIARCNQSRCRHCWVTNPPSAEELSDLYQTEESHMWNSAAFQVVQDYEENPECVRRYFHRERTQYLDRFFPNELQNRETEFLDVGCSTGVFVATLKDRGLKSVGHDLSETATRTGRERLGQNLTSQPLNSGDFDNRFDVATCYDVIEHVLDPRALVEDVARCVKPGGAVAFRTPNHSGWLLALTGKKWLWYIPPAHLHYFNANSIRLLFEEAGLQVDAIRTGSSTYLFYLWYYLAFWRPLNTTLSVNM